MAASPTTTTEVLEESRRLGFLGPTAIDLQIEHALRFGKALLTGWPVAAPLVADLGAGGGLPSLPLAVAHTQMRFVLVEASGKRASFLVWASVELDATDRIEVWTGRAETFGHDDARRASFDGVVARGFGPPATTIECSAPLLRPGGRCVISEPPGPRAWPPAALATVGLRQIEGPAGFAVFERTAEAIPTQYPRPSRTQRREPLFTL